MRLKQRVLNFNNWSGHANVGDRRHRTQKQARITCGPRTWCATLMALIGRETPRKSILMCRGHAISFLTLSARHRVAHATPAVGQVAGRQPRTAQHGNPRESQRIFYVACCTTFFLLTQSPVLFTAVAVDVDLIESSFCCHAYHNMGLRMNAGDFFALNTQVNRKR